MTDRPNPVPDGHHTVTPYLTVRGADRLIEFARNAFGATAVRRMERPDGTIHHAEIRIGDSIVMIAEATEQWPPMPTMLHLYVADVDDVHRRALAAGGASIGEPADMPYGDRSGGVTDPCGNQWWIATRIEDLSDDEIARRAAAHEAAPAGDA